MDTQMGVSVVRSAGFAHISRYLSTSPAEQTTLQVLHKEKLSKMVLDACIEMTQRGASSIFLYCNSLAGSVDMESIRRHLSVRIITPLDVYHLLARRHRKIAVMAANCQGLAAIELSIQGSNPSCAIYGSATLQLVEAIEAGVAPDEIMDRLCVRELVQALCKMGGEVLVLGCTHFPYLLSHIEAAATLPVIDPTHTMLSIIEQA